MSYASVASSLSELINSMNSHNSSIESRDIDSIWSGSAHDTLSSNLDTCVSNIKTQASYLNNFVTALNNCDKYLSEKKNKESYESDLRGLDPNSVNYSSSYSYLQSHISSCNTNMNMYKSLANSSLKSIGTISSQFEVVDFELENGYIEYISDIGDLLKLFSNNSLKQIGEGDSLYNYVSEAEVDAMLNGIKSNYSGRNAAVNCAIGIISMAASVGKKLDYDWGGGHSTITDVDSLATGVDCSAFASWAVEQGSSTFTTAGTSGLISRGKGVSYADAQPGDILVHRSGGSGHARFVVANDVENSQIIVAEASNGVTMGTYTYSNLKNNGYQARDLSEYY